MQNLLQVRQHKIMPIYPSEILEFILGIQQNKSNIMKPEEKKTIDYLFVDCRLENKLITIPKTCHIPSNFENKVSKKYFLIN